MVLFNLQHQSFFSHLSLQLVNKEMGCIMDSIYQCNFIYFFKSCIKHKHCISGLGKLLDMLSNIRILNSNFRESLLKPPDVRGYGSVKYYYRCFS